MGFLPPSPSGCWTSSTSMAPRQCACSGNEMKVACQCDIRRLSNEQEAHYKRRPGALYHATASRRILDYTGEDGTLFQTESSNLASKISPFSEGDPDPIFSRHPRMIVISCLNKRCTAYDSTSHFTPNVAQTRKGHTRKHPKGAQCRSRPVHENAALTSPTLRSNMSSSRVRQEVALTSFCAENLD